MTAPKFWLIHESMPSIAARPRVCPSPIMATNVEPLGINVSGHSDRACSVMNSSASRITRSFTLPVGSQGILPFQYSFLARRGVEPFLISATAPIFTFGYSSAENASNANDFLNFFAALNAHRTASICSSTDKSMRTARRCSSIGGSEKSKFAKLVQLVRGLSEPADVPTA